jgi:hypothetical protein
MGQLKDGSARPDLLLQPFNDYCNAQREVELWDTPLRCKPVSRDTDENQYPSAKQNGRQSFH